MFDQYDIRYGYMITIKKLKSGTIAEMIASSPKISYKINWIFGAEK